MSPAEVVREGLRTDRAGAERQLRVSRVTGVRRVGPARLQHGRKRQPTKLLCDRLASSDVSLASSDVSLASSDVSLATSDVSLASSDVSLASSDVSLATSDVSLASSDVSLATSDVSLASSDVSLATSDVSLASSDVSLASSDVSLASSDVSLANVVVFGRCAQHSVCRTVQPSIVRVSNAEAMLYTVVTSMGSTLM